ncbi:MAG: hypothetical protein ACLPKB_24845 [Xanthobacteraceae bacterium]
MPLYKPPTNVSTIQIPYQVLVTRADPEFERRKHREVEYEFQGRAFLADPYVRGAYNQNSNVYPVGQPFGGTDPAYAGRPFYSGVPTGGWA